MTTERKIKVMVETTAKTGVPSCALSSHTGANAGIELSSARMPMVKERSEVAGSQRGGYIGDEPGEGREGGGEDLGGWCWLMGWEGSGRRDGGAF